MLSLAQWKLCLKVSVHNHVDTMCIVLLISKLLRFSLSTSSEPDDENMNNMNRLAMMTMSPFSIEQYAIHRFYFLWLYIYMSGKYQIV